MKVFSILMLGILAMTMILLGRRRPKNVVSDEWMRESRYDKSGW